jgi:hypothetical protein
MVSRPRTLLFCRLPFLRAVLYKLFSLEYLIFLCPGRLAVHVGLCARQTVGRDLGGNVF